MKTGQIIIVGSAILMVVVLAFLSRGVVENDQDLMETKETQPDSQGPVVSSTGDMANHSALPPQAQQTADSLRALLKDSDDIEKSIIFADSLAALFANFQKTDSAAVYASLGADLQPSLRNWQKAGDAWFEAFSFALQPERVQLFGAKAQEYLSKVVEADTSLVDARAKLAITRVATDNPMQGILALRELANQHPENELAQFNLARFSMQTGQFDKAVSRFETLLSYHPTNEEARYLYAESLWRTGSNQKAIGELTLLIGQTEKEEVQAAAQALLQEIRK